MSNDAASIDLLKNRIAGISTSEFRGQVRVVVPTEHLFASLEFLHGERVFDFLVDITCVDYLNYRGATDRFGLVYVLTNTVTNEQLMVRTFLNEPDLAVPSVTSLWEGANWMEREVWDMFGITFEGHPDHRRILLPEEFAAFPLRKDYPLQGRGERHNFPVLTRDSA
ncbi:MAG TPA: NADH-quinone oxidoreductase subunit C [Pirellulales bacterium]|jgi:NADH-quinone oxidoreductase subunit C|nr:NADH-quinone oxidoreductase subunit C [Pirellulales bacterium]